MMIGTMAVAASLLPVVLGFGRRVNQSAVWVWLSALALQNAVLWWMAQHGQSTWLVTWLAYPVTLWLGLRALRTLPGMPQVIWPLALGFLGIWGVASVVGDRVEGYSVFIAPLHSMTLAGMAALGIVRATEPDRSWRDLTVAMGAFLLYGPFLVVWPMSAYLTATSPEWVLPMWEARAGLLIVGSLLFAVALW